MGEDNEDTKTTGEREKVDSASPCDYIASRDELDGLPSADQCKGVFTHFVNAVNNRIFDISQLPWTRIAPNYVGVLHDPNAPVRSAQDIIEQQQEWISMAPTYSLRLLDIEVSYLNEETGRAEVFYTAETFGLYPDVSVHTTGLIEFRRIGQRWMASRFQGARGMSAGPMNR